MSEDRIIRVLIADDEEGIRRGECRALEGLKVQGPGLEGEFTVAIDEAPDGLTALRKLEEGPVDIIMLDHQMPGCTGMEILEKLVADKSDTLAIMVTAYASLEMAVKATKQGAYDFLAKPFTPSDLRKVVEKAARHMLSVKAARRLAHERHRVRFEFLSVLAHELKAPLGAVEGYLRLIEEGVTRDNPEAQARVVDRCLVRLEGMRKLIFDLLDLTRIESGQKKRVLHAIDLAELLPRIMETFAPEADVRQIAMELECTGDTTMQGDAGELEIILNNLVSNAVKYNRDGGRVTVDVRGDEEMLMIQVTDTGIGMTEEEMATLFGEFVRIKNEKTKTILGSGLGLSIIRRLARLNGGDVTVRSEDNVGSTFTVTLARSGVSEHHSVDAGSPVGQES
jgi:signal transduction histidine kinase